MSMFMSTEIYRLEYEVSVKFYAVVVIMMLSVLAKMIREKDLDDFPEETI